jgi:hypothetical protein
LINFAPRLATLLEHSWCFRQGDSITLAGIQILGSDAGNKRRHVGDGKFKMMSWKGSCNFGWFIREVYKFLRYTRNLLK